MTIQEAIQEASVAILLITSHFLTSTFISKEEIPEILRRHQEGKLVMFPIITRACAWRDVKWLKELHVRPKNGNPVWRDNGYFVDQELAAIAVEVAEIVRER